ncbi:hypothetical protein PHMEG_00023699, partial [Phytophthora megakarya]
PDPDRFFDEDGDLNIKSAFSLQHFEAFVLTKMNQRRALPAEYTDEMKKFFTGLKRIEATRNQTGAGEAKMAGKMALPYTSYAHASKETLLLSDGDFSHLFLTLQWNLTCRSQYVESINSGHLSNEDDSIDVVFHKSKSNQVGTEPKDPRHYCAGRVLGLLPTTRTRAFFSGALQRNRFRKAFGRGLGKQDSKHDYGTHSVRKGVATYACNGSTGGPSIVSVCLRCGWSLGELQDRYFRYEAAGDQFLGRVVAGLPVNSAQFAVLPPHFKDNSSSIVRKGVTSMLSALANDANLQLILKLYLASLVYHYDFLSSKLPIKHSL